MANAMRLILEQKKWKELPAEQAAGAELPHIVIHPGLPWEEERPAKLKTLYEWNAPAGTTLSIVSEQQASSSVDWPLRIVEALLVREGDVVEARVIVVYTILEYWTAAMWRGPKATLDAERERIMKALTSGRPDWRRREIVALWQLYQLDPTEYPR